MEMSSVQILMLGTATSSALPLVPCLAGGHGYPPSFAEIARPTPAPADGSEASRGRWQPDGEWPHCIECPSCRAAVDDGVPEGWKNRRGNTSAVVRKKGKDGQWKNIIVDVGKTFREQASKYFPRWGVQNIDAVLLTHGHADAYFGLDDLREWCIRQGTSIPVYLDQETFDIVSASFPYMTDATKASGGGGIPSLEWNIIEHEGPGSEFELEGVSVKVLPVEHGIYFGGKAGTAPTPFMCLGYMFDREIAYISDVSTVPESTYQAILRRHEADRAPPASTAKAPHVRALTDVAAHAQPHSAQVTPRSTRPSTPVSGTDADAIESSTSAPPLPILIVDSLWPLRTHTSHTNFPEALDIAIRLNATRAYFVGVVHPVTHFMYEELCRSLKGEDGQQREHPEADMAERLIKKVWADKQFKGKRGEGYKAWRGTMRPAWDGLVLDANGEVSGKDGSKGGWGV